MGFPENVIAKGERIERSIHPHWMTVFVPAVAGLLLLAAAIAVAWATPDDDSGNRIQWIAVGVLVLVAIPLVLVPFLRWRSTHYVVTSHRVMVRRGIINKTGKDITLSKITDVSFNQTLFDRVIRSGSLHIESAGDSPDEQLNNIPNSNVVQQLINRLIDEDDLRRRSIIGRGPMSRAGDQIEENATSAGDERGPGADSGREGGRVRDLEPDSRMPQAPRSGASATRPAASGPSSAEETTAVPQGSRGGALPDEDTTAEDVTSATDPAGRPADDPSAGPKANDSSDPALETRRFPEV